MDCNLKLRRTEVLVMVYALCRDFRYMFTLLGNVCSLALEARKCITTDVNICTRMCCDE